MKTVEELLRDRYKVVADYFYNPYKIGDIITVLYDDRSVHLTTTHYSDEFGETVDQANHYNPARLKDFPHLFQPLPWWSDRKSEDMPEYLHCPSRGTFHKVDEWHNTSFIADGRTKKQLANYSPATREEYELFKKKEKL